LWSCWSHLNMCLNFCVIFGVLYLHFCIRVYPLYPHICGVSSFYLCILYLSSVSPCLPYLCSFISQFRMSLRAVSCSYPFTFISLQLHVFSLVSNISEQLHVSLPVSYWCISMLLKMSPPVSLISVQLHMSLAVSYVSLQLHVFPLYLISLCSLICPPTVSLISV
jgi:hypothetical protein